MSFVCIDTAYTVANDEVFIINGYTFATIRTKVANGYLYKYLKIF